MQKVLFICMGNICRSPMAEGILRHKIRQYQLPLSVDSAGTHNYHEDQQYDQRARAELKKHGIDVDDLRSRPVRASDFSDFDVLFAADTQNISQLQRKFGGVADKVQLMTAFSKKHHQQSVPDPYYNGGFSGVYAMLDESIDEWLKSAQMLPTE